MATTARLDIPLASLAEDADVEESVNPGFEHIDGIMARDGQGPLADVPTPTVKLRGAYYWVTDARVLLRCDGVAWRAVVEFPVGGVMDWPAATEPPTADGDLVMWLELAGQTVQRSAFPELAAAWGINAATFALPNRSGRAPVGAGTGAGLTTRTVGQTFGSEVHWLTAAQSGVNGNGATAAADLPRAQPAYGGVIGGYANSVYANPGYTAVAYFGGGNEGANGNGIHAHGLVARNADQSHPIVQPSIVTRYFVRAR